MKSKTKMSWSRLWRKVEALYLTPMAMRTEEEYRLTYDEGLCFTVIHLTDAGVFLYDIFRVGYIPFVTDDCGAYWWTINGSADHERAMFAGFIAAMGYEEFKKMFWRRNKDVIKAFKDIEEYLDIK